MEAIRLAEGTRELDPLLLQNNKPLPPSDTEISSQSFTTTNRVCSFERQHQSSKKALRCMDLH